MLFDGPRCTGRQRPSIPEGVFARVVNCTRLLQYLRALYIVVGGDRGLPPELLSGGSVILQGSTMSHLMYPLMGEDSSVQ